MFLMEPNETPMDLRFRLFRIFVRVHPMFWLVAVILGWDWTRVRLITDSGVGELFLWVACVFVSILWHEMGHVLMGRVFGHDGHIVLYSFGGLAIGSNGQQRRWQRIAVSAAGPGAQLLLYAALRVLFLERWSPVTLPLHMPVVVLAVFMLLSINLYWALLNLLPVWPLDGGMITRELCTGASPARGLVISLWISLLTSGFIAIHAFVVSYTGEKLHPWLPGQKGSLFTPIFFAMFAVQSFLALQEQRRRSSYWDQDDSDRLPWER